MLDDLLVNARHADPLWAQRVRISRSWAASGTSLLVNGEPRDTFHARTGEVVRFYLTNVASSRTFNVSFGDAPMKVSPPTSAASSMRSACRVSCSAPAERYVVEVRFEHPGQYALVNSVQAINHFKGEFDAEVDTLGIVTVDAAPATPDYAHEFRDAARQCRRLEATSTHFVRAFDQTARQDVHV